MGLLYSVFCYTKFYFLDYTICIFKQPQVTVLMLLVNLYFDQLIKEYIHQSCKILSYKNTTPEEQAKFIIDFAVKINKILNQVRMRKKWTFDVLSFSDHFYKCAFDLVQREDNQSQQYLQITKEIKYLCGKSISGIFYLSNYLVICCKKMAKDGKTPSEINRILKERANQLKNMYGVKQTRENEQLLLSREDNSQQFQAGEFICEKHTPFVILLDGQSSQKESLLEEKILQMVQVGKKTLISSIVCSMKHASSNLKLEGPQNKSSMHRVKQKLLGDYITKKVVHYEKNPLLQKCNSITQWLSQQRDYVAEITRQILFDIKEVSFNVTDLLRGKCMFNNVVSINNAVRALTNNIEKQKKRGKNISLSEVQNRLDGITKDVVAKIKIEQLICQFQFVLYYNKIENEIHHKMYEIVRSKNLSPISLLFQWNDKSTSNYFSDLADHLKCGIDKMEFVTISEKIKKLRKFINFVHWTQKKVEKNLIFDRKEILKSIENLELKIEKIKALASGRKLRTMGFFAEVGEYELAASLQNLSQFLIKKQSRILTDEQQMLGSIKLKLEKYPQSLQHYMNNIKILQNYLNHDGIRVSKSLMNIGNIYLLQGKAQQAIQYYERVLNILKSNFNNEQTNIIYSNIMNNLGIIYQGQGRLDESITCFQNSLQVVKKMRGRISSQYSAALNMVGNYYYSAGKLSESLNTYIQSYQIAEKVLGAQSRQCALFLENIGNVYSRIQKYHESLNFYSRSLQIFQTIEGKNSSECSKILRNIGTVHNKMGNFDQAMSYFEKSRKMQLKSLGKQSVGYSKILSNIGYTQLKMQKYGQALKSLNQALSIVEKMKGNKYLLIQILNSMGLTYQKMEKYVQAIQNFTMAIEVLQSQKNKVQRSQYTEVLSNFGDLYFQMKQYDKALEYYKSCLVKFEQLNSKDNIYCIKYLQNIGKVFQLQCKFQESISYFLKASKIYEKLNIQFTIQSAQNVSRIGSVYNNMKKFTQSISYYNKALQIRQKLNSKSSLQYAMDLRNSGQTKEMMGNVEEAIQYYILASDCLMTLQENRLINQMKFEVLFNIGRLYLLTQRIEVALQYFFQSEGIAKRLDKSSGLQSVYVISNTIASVYQNIGKLAESKTYYKVSLEIIKSMPGLQSRQNQFKIILKIAQISCLESKFQDALVEFQSSIELLKEMQDKKEQYLPQILLQMAMIYLNINNLIESLKYFEDAYNKLIKYQGTQSQRSIKVAHYIDNLKQMIKNN